MNILALWWTLSSPSRMLSQVGCLSFICKALEVLDGAVSQSRYTWPSITSCVPRFGPLMRPRVWEAVLPRGSQGRPSGRCQGFLCAPPLPRPSRRWLRLFPHGCPPAPLPRCGAGQLLARLKAGSALAASGLEAGVLSSVSLSVLTSEGGMIVRAMRCRRDWCGRPRAPQCLVRARPNSLLLPRGPARPAVPLRMPPRAVLVPLGAESPNRQGLSLLFNQVAYL